MTVQKLDCDVTDFTLYNKIFTGRAKTIASCVGTAQVTSTHPRNVNAHHSKPAVGMQSWSCPSARTAARLLSANCLMAGPAKGTPVQGRSQDIAVADPGFRKGGFMHMCTVATTPPFDAHVYRCNESGCCCFNGL